MATPYIGEIRLFGGGFAPRDWALCNGQLLSISSNTALFSLLGTTYGGDGVQTFALPNMQSRSPVHWGTGVNLTPYVIGEVAGVEQVGLNSTQMPQHTHLVAASLTATSAAPAGAVPASFPGRTPTDIYAATSDGTVMNQAMVSQAGGNVPFSIIQPVLCITFIIALNGIFPSRN
jgi:microcystin-dependent protein